MESIVLTGGPRAGKSTVLKYLQENLPLHNIQPVIVPELATLMFSAGVKIQDIMPNQAMNKMFQMAMIRNQLNWEDSYRSIAEISEKASGVKTVLICDRGAIDNLAFIEATQRQYVLTGLNQDYNSLRCRYKSVIHMETSAVGTDYEELMKDNPVRHETTTEQAIKSDRELLEVWRQEDYSTEEWTGLKRRTTPHFVVKYSDDFSKKCEVVINIIVSLLNE